VVSSLVDSPVYAASVFCALSLHDALPIWPIDSVRPGPDRGVGHHGGAHRRSRGPVGAVAALSCSATGPGPWHRLGRELWIGYEPDRKSTRLNSSHGSIPYAVFCMKQTRRR